MCDNTNPVGEQLNFAFGRNQKRKKSKQRKNDDVASLFFFLVIIIAFVIVELAFYTPRSYVLTEQDLMNAYHMKVRSVFYYPDIIVWNENGSTHSENLDWKIVIYDSKVDSDVYGTVYGNSTIFIRSGQMPSQIKRTCNHEICHNFFGDNERGCYAIQWSLDYSVCQWLYMNATQTYLQDRMKYWELYG